MGRKKNTVLGDDTSLSNLLGDMSGVNVVFGNEVETKLAPPKHHFSTGLPPLDIILGEGDYNNSDRIKALVSGNYDAEDQPWGLGSGKLTELYGPNSSGKSDLALKLTANFLDSHDAGFSLWYDQENAIDDKKVAQYPVFKNGRLAKFYAFPNATDLFDNIIEVCSKINEQCPEAPVLIVLDSLAAVVTESEEEAEVGKVTVAELPRFLSRNIPKIMPYLEATNAHLVILNQIRSKIGKGGYGDPTDSPGGETLKFFATYRIRTASVGKFYFVKPPSNASPKPPPDGFIAQYATIKNRRVPPLRSVQIPLVYTPDPYTGISGLSKAWGIFQVLNKYKAIKHVGKGNFTLKGYTRDGALVKFSKPDWSMLVHTDEILQGAAADAMLDWARFTMVNNTLTKYSESEDSLTNQQSNEFAVEDTDEDGDDLFSEESGEDDEE